VVTEKPSDALRSSNEPAVSEEIDPGYAAQASSSGREQKAKQRTTSPTTAGAAHQESSPHAARSPRALEAAVHAGRSDSKAVDAGSGYVSAAAEEARTVAAAVGGFKDYRELWGNRAAAGFAGQQSELKSRLSRKEAEAALQRLTANATQDLDEVRQMRKLVDECRDEESF